MNFGPRHLLFAGLLLLPLLVAAFDWSFLAALLLLLALLLLHWAAVIAGISRGGKGPAMVLETITMSHYAEKVRWCLDRLGVDYQEQKCAGLLGVVFTGRTVPRLKFRSGIVQSSIGHSPEILRFLWGQYHADLGERAAFLEPTSARLELEKRIDRYGVDLQVWVYYQMLPYREELLRLWGVHDPEIPLWQRKLLPVLYPLLAAFLRRTFKISDAHYLKAVEHIDKMLADVDEMLADGRSSLLGGDLLDYVDITFAALSGLWLQPEAYGGGKTAACRLAKSERPPTFLADTGRWKTEYPRATAFIERLYAEARFNEDQHP